MSTLAELEEVIPLVRASIPTPQYAWPLLKGQTGVEVIVKHENHTSIGVFKARGGIVYFDRLNRERPKVKGIITAKPRSIAGLRWGACRRGYKPKRAVPRSSQRHALRIFLLAEAA